MNPIAHRGQCPRPPRALHRSCARRLPGDVTTRNARSRAGRTSSCRVRAAVGRVAGHVLLHLALTDRRLVALVLVQALDHFLVSARGRLGHIALRRLLSPTGAGATEGDAAAAINPKCRTVPATAFRMSSLLAGVPAVLTLGLQLKASSTTRSRPIMPTGVDAVRRGPAGCDMHDHVGQHERASFARLRRRR